MKKYSYKNSIIFLFLASLLIFFSVNRFLQKKDIFFDTVTSFVAYPFLKLSSCLLDSSTLLKNSLQQVLLSKDHNAFLQEQNRMLYNQLIELQSYALVKEEAEQLKQFNKRYVHDNRLAVKILSCSCDELTGEHFLLLDAGKFQNVKVHDIVVYQNMLLGKVMQVYPWYCRVMLITDKKSQVAALCKKTKLTGVYAGTGTQKGSLLYVERIKKPRHGDILISSGEGAIFPYGFGIGTIDALHEDGLHYTITVKPFIDFSTIRYCSIIAR